ncbi:MAG TPA: Ig-like domain-containing protein [Thermoanaerobaculia bacterium]|jgi:hypothetical protein|nr:Ig-like domain-containing protein [Thermoanaerobaculia bacterium]
MCKRSRFAIFVLFTSILMTPLSAQDRDPVSPGVGRAVLLATRSIQIDQGTLVVSGDIVVNDAGAAPFLGEKQLALDSGVHTPAGASLIANSIDLDSGAVAGGDVYVNVLTNNGTIAGQTFTPLALPVFSVLPTLLDRVAGSTDVVVAAGATVDVEEGAYKMLVVGNGGTANFLGGGYTFTHVNVAHGGAIVCAAPCNTVVRGNLTLDSDAMIGTGPDAAAIQLHVGGAVTVGRDGTLSANVLAPNGTITFGRETNATGAFYARDILVRRDSRIELASAYNAPPVADAQSVFTDGATPVSITLTGSDPEGQPLTFAIVSSPTNGTLSPLVGATTTYTPTSSMNLQDSFTFSVTDPGGASGSAVVTINPPRVEPPPPPPTTVVANDLAASVTQETPETLVLTAGAPEGVSLTFSIVPSSGPFHGTLGAVTYDDQATVVYTPDTGFTGTDSFDFEACGVISGDMVCDTATYTLTVLEHREELPDLAHDVQVSTTPDEPVLISLGLTSVETLRTVVIRPNAAFLDSVEVAGTVADANNDGTGDNVMVLPAAVPVFMSAGVGLSGAPGSNGKVRMQFEWDLSGISGLAPALRSANVNLNTHRGSIDSLDTVFYNVLGSNDGALTNGDFAAVAERVRGATMPVPPSMAVNDEGTFSFSVFGELLSALYAGQNYLTIQGRVDESLAGPARGLEVRTSAELNRDDFLEPQLAITTPGVTAPLTYTILTLPANGTLFDNGTPITSVQYTLPGSTVTFVPATGFVGDTSFQFQVSSGTEFGFALVNVHVAFTDCATNPAGCNNGR